MTVSRKEAEAKFLDLISDGDGEFVTLEELNPRDALILKDLSDGGYISGSTFFGGSASYRITAAGETRCAEIWRELSVEEVAASEAKALEGDNRTNFARRLRAFLTYFADRFIWPLVVGVAVLVIAAFTFL